MTQDEYPLHYGFTCASCLIVSNCRQTHRGIILPTGYADNVVYRNVDGKILWDGHDPIMGTGWDLIVPNCRQTHKGLPTGYADNVDYRDVEIVDGKILWDGHDPIMGTRWDGEKSTGTGWGWEEIHDKGVGMGQFILPCHSQIIPHWVLLST